jgi:peptide/nickel transport system substrate-binding protein
MTCKQVSADPEDPTNYYNDANYCDEEYDRLYAEQKVELDRDRREELVHEMLTIWQQSAVYNVLWEEPDTIAYVKDRFEGFVQQPAETGPVIFSNTSPTYARLKPFVATATASGTDEDGGGGNGAIIAILAVAVLGLGVALVVVSRRRSAYDRE